MRRKAKALKTIPKSTYQGQPIMMKQTGNWMKFATKMTEIERYKWTVPGS
jgi:hypothetical protein